MNSEAVSKITADPFQTELEYVKPDVSAMPAFCGPVLVGGGVAEGVAAPGDGAQVLGQLSCLKSSAGVKVTG